MDFLSSAKNSAYNLYVNAVNSVTPALSTSKFYQEGVLTPDEFVQAGDLLIYKCPTWSWESGDPQKRVSYLPPNKQYLITRNVPCMVRADSLKGASKNDKIVNLEGMGGEDWIATEGQEEQSSEILDMVPDPIPPKAQHDDDENFNEDDVPDMDSWDQQNLVDEDPAALQKQPENTDNILKTRTYDISIAYDKYHQTPRVWLFGYNENGQPLKPADVFSDISQDHAHKTVTIDPHPHTSVPCAYIHPCKHASVMKKIITNLAESGKDLRVDQYLFLFLKFLSAVLPTIEYDNTFAMDGWKGKIKVSSSSFIVERIYIFPLMKKIITNLAESGKDLRVDQYLFLFLKFLSAVLPTIEYDNTFAMDG